MTDIRIDFTYDNSECDTCGDDYAEGATVYFDGVMVIDLVPIAHCYNGVTYDSEKVFAAVLEALGHTVSFGSADALPGGWSREATLVLK